MQLLVQLINTFLITIHFVCVCFLSCLISFLFYLFVSRDECTQRQKTKSRKRIQTYDWCILKQNVPFSYNFIVFVVWKSKNLHFSFMVHSGKSGWKSFLYCLFALTVEKMWCDGINQFYLLFLHETAPAEFTSVSLFTRVFFLLLLTQSISHIDVQCINIRNFFFYFIHKTSFLRYFDVVFIFITLHFTRIFCVVFFFIIHQKKKKWILMFICLFSTRWHTMGNGITYNRRFYARIYC